MVTRAAAQKGNIPARLKGQVILMAGYCSAIRNDTAAAGLAADMAREEGVEPSPGLQALDALSINSKPKFKVAKEVSLLDYRIAERVGGLPQKMVLEKGEPALLVALATDPSTPIDLGLPATEAAARLNALTPKGLRLSTVLMPRRLLRTPCFGQGPKAIARRAALFKAAEAEQTPMRKTRLIRAFLDDAKHQGLSMISARMIAPAAAAVRPAPEISWFAETGVEIGLASGRYDMARNWIASVMSRASFRRPRLLACPGRYRRYERAPARQKPGELESYAAGGKFAPGTLQRLATVLEGLDYLVPIPLWEAANRAPQTNSGYLRKQAFSPNCRTHRRSKSSAARCCW